jgi:hypothetical protein
MKRLAIIGKGTAGVLALSHFERWAPDCELQLYYDESIKPQPVGEGATLQLPIALSLNCNFTYDDLHLVDGTFKHGIKKTNWADGCDFTHFFTPPSVSYHFNAGKLQSYLLEKLKNKVKIVDSNVTAEQIDADFIMDCSGKPQDYDQFNMSEAIPVNAVHVTQCYWDHPRFQYTLTIARPYGWVFGIPLQNRCSIGYMYNKDINTLDEVKQDVLNIFKEYNLNPSEHTNSFSFKNYFRKENFSSNIVYNGNASFFLEPIEATSIHTMDDINRKAFDIWFSKRSPAQCNQEYITILSQIENIIMLHYYAGSIFKTPFWEYAIARGEKNIRKALMNPTFLDIIKNSQRDMKQLNTESFLFNYGSWSLSAFSQNLNGLSLYKKLENDIKHLEDKH